jgi:myo-inositol-1-phosphate synthase
VLYGDHLDFALKAYWSDLDTERGWPGVGNSINVAVAGVGNNACALIQGCAYYREFGPDVPGVRVHTLGGYTIRDINFVCAYDISREKVGQDISSAIFASPNNFPRIQPVPVMNVAVRLGPKLDSLHESLTSLVPTDSSSKETRDLDVIAEELSDSGAHVVLNFLPSGSPEAARFYARAAALAGCAYINATPDPIVNDSNTVSFFEQRGLPLLGDDLESQMGATVIHRAVLRTLASKGIRVTGSYQINVGGNMDFRNLVVRGESKQKSKRRGLMLAADADNIHAVPAAAYFSFLGDRKIAHITVEAEGWLGCKNSVEIRLEIQDSSSAASVVADLIRIAKYELDLGRSGVVEETGFYFKSPRTKLDTYKAESLLARYNSP